MKKFIIFALAITPVILWKYNTSTMNNNNEESKYIPFTPRATNNNTVVPSPQHRRQTYSDSQRGIASHHQYENTPRQITITRSQVLPMAIPSENNTFTITNQDPHPILIKLRPDTDDKNVFFYEEMIAAHSSKDFTIPQHYAKVRLSTYRLNTRNVIEPRNDKNIIIVNGTTLSSE